MGFLQRISTLFQRTTELRSLSPAWDTWSDMIGGSSAGVSVSESTAMQCEAVYACIQLISSRIMTLPVHIHDGSSGRKDDHPVRQLLSFRANPDMSAAVFKQTFMVNLLLTGRAFATIVPGPDGYAKALYPLPSLSTRAVRKNGELYYETILDGKRFVFYPESIIHVMGMTADGITGISPIASARETIGLAMALEQFASKFFANGANAGGLVMAPKMDPDALTKFIRAFQANYAGLTNAYKNIVLPDGFKYERSGVDPEKAQALESRIHQLRAIARIYAVPPHMIGDLERATFSNIEHQSIEFRQNTIEPWTSKIEQELDAKLLLELERPKLAIRMNLDALLRSDTKTRYEAHNLAIQGGWKTINEIRALEGLAPITGGDKLRVPMNMEPIDQANKPKP